MGLATGSSGGLSKQSSRSQATRHPSPCPQSWHSLWKYTVAILILTQLHQWCLAVVQELPVTLFLLVEVGASGSPARLSLANYQ